MVNVNNIQRLYENARIPKRLKADLGKIVEVLQEQPAKRISSEIAAIVSSLKVILSSNETEGIDEVTHALREKLELDRSTGEIDLNGEKFIGVSCYKTIHAHLLRIQDAIDAANIPIGGFAISRGKKVAVYQKNLVENLPYVTKREDQLIIDQETGEAMCDGKKCISLARYAALHDMSYRILQEKIARENIPIIGHAISGKKTVDLYEKKALEKIAYVRQKTGKEEKTMTYAEKVTSLQNKNDFLVWFRELGIQNDQWKRVVWMKEESSLPAAQGGIGKSMAGVYRAIIGDKRFPSYKNDFLKFMGVSEHEIDVEVSHNPWRKLILQCKTPADFLNAFKEQKIRKDNWKSSKWLKANGFAGIVSAICSDPRFMDWVNFMEFMGEQAKGFWTRKIMKCKTRDDFLKLFDELKIENWTSSASFIQKNKRLYRAIVRDKRFFSWETFLKFMEVGGRQKWTALIAKTHTPDDFLKIFNENGLVPEQWKSARWLQVNGFSGLYCAIIGCGRFVHWEEFLDYMDIISNQSEAEFETLSNLKLEEAMGLLADDPLKLKQYMRFAHPELNQEEVDNLVRRSFKGLRDGQIETTEEKYMTWQEALSEIELHEEMESETDENSITFTGTAPGCTHVFVAGVYTRRKKIDDDGNFHITIPLRTGESNEIRVMGIEMNQRKRSSQQIFTVRQSGEKDDIDSLVQLLSKLGVDAHKNIQKNPGKAKYLTHCMEQSLIKKFSRSFHEGERYVQALMAKETTNTTMKAVLNKVLTKFKRIHHAELPGVVDGSLLFFQKYCALEIRRRIGEELPGVILANDPGTGKTRIVQAATADAQTTVITPNSVVSAWDEESGRVLEDTEVIALRNMHSDIRKNILRSRRATREVLNRTSHTYVNREFLRKTRDAERFTLLSDDETIVVHDEAHSRTNEQSEQSKGAHLLESRFQILVSATPFKDPKTFRRMMAILKPDDARFLNDAAFTKAFPPDDPQALKTLNLLKDDVTIRFRKEDVMETVDPSQALEQQKHKLPIKEFVDSNERGSFTMSEEQAESIYLIFTNWPKWCRQNEKFIPEDEITKEDHLRTNNGFAKRHALRQATNNPAYIGAKGPDAKFEEVKKIVAESLKDNRKTVIFCAYEAQALKYAEAFSSLRPALYIGQTSKLGDVKDSKDKPKKFKKGETGDSQHGWVLDSKGYPVEDPKGEPMSALDFERITFQNAAERKLLISTYNAGSVGTTFTAGKALIADDLPKDCIEEIQAEDRIHRIDPARMTHASVKYYRMKSVYPESFLKKVKNRWLVKDNGSYKEFSSEQAANRFAEKRELEVHNAYELFFEQGTYDEVHSQNLRAQRTMFRLINDGIADESALEEHQIPFAGLMNGDTDQN